jgi:hypothetical protein
MLVWCMPVTRGLVAVSWSARSTRTRRSTRAAAPAIDSRAAAVSGPDSPRVAGVIPSRHRPSHNVLAGVFSCARCAVNPARQPEIVACSGVDTRDAVRVDDELQAVLGGRQGAPRGTRHRDTGHSPAAVAPSSRCWRKGRPGATRAGTVAVLPASRLCGPSERAARIPSGRTSAKSPHPPAILDDIDKLGESRYPEGNSHLRAGHEKDVLAAAKQRVEAAGSCRPRAPRRGRPQRRW